MESVDDIKRARRVQTALTRRKLKEAAEEIQKMEDEGSTEIYVNGEAAELREIFKKEREKLKLRTKVEK